MKVKRMLSAFLTFVLALTLSISAFSMNIYRYKDVPESYWAYSAIMDMTDRGMFSGTSTPVNGVGTFSPEMVMTRAQFVAVLTRYLFPDELSNMADAQPWYANNYTVALEQGLLSSDELDNGKLNRRCSRQEMAMLLVRATYIANGEVATNLLPTERIADYNLIGKKYQSYVLQAFSLGLLVGIDSKGTFNPTGGLSRAQAATAIYRLIDPTTRAVSPSATQISFTWEDGTTYSGEYRNGEANGLGTMIFPDVGTYTGFFVNGKREGIGTFQWDVGDTYTGIWNNDAMCGTGTYTFADGYTLKGIWSNNNIAVESIFMEPSSLKLEVGVSTRIVARCIPSQITDLVTWKSSNPSVVSVTGFNNTGKLTAKSSGSVTITAVTASGKTATCTVTVTNPPVEKISLNYGDYDLCTGGNIDLTASILPENASSNITWSTSDSAVAVVSAKGSVTAVAAGTAIISGKTENGLIATCYINVFDEFESLWDGDWNMYNATSRGTKTATSSCGVCEIDTENMTATISFSPYKGKYIDLASEESYLLSGSYETGSYGYEFAFSSVTEDKIILEIKTIYNSTYGSDSISTSYYVLERS